MNKKGSWFLLGVIISGVMMVIGVVVYGEMTKEKTGYVVTGELFEKYAGTQERKIEMSELAQKQKLTLDSLQLNLQLMQQAGDENFESQKMIFLKLRDQFSMEYQERDEKYTNQLWEQINKYGKSFGNENGYQYIFGANGSGGLMYVNEEQNVTNQLLDFINRRYEGEK